MWREDLGFVDDSSTGNLSPAFQTQDQHVHDLFVVAAVDGEGNDKIVAVKVAETVDGVVSKNGKNIPVNVTQSWVLPNWQRSCHYCYRWESPVTVLRGP